MNHLPMLETKRLVLRDISILDAPDMYEYATDYDIGPLAGWAPHRSIQETIGIIGMFLDSKKRGEPGVFAVVLKENNKMIGTIELYNYVPGFKAELGYALSKAYWGRGIIPEAAEAIINWGFVTLGLKRIEIATFVDNYRSKRVCEKLGFTEEGVARKGYLRYDGIIFDKVIYGMTDTEYFNKTKNLK